MVKFKGESPNILIIRFSSFGDIVKCSVFPRLLKARFPTSHITFVTKSNFKCLIEYNPCIDRKIYYEKKPHIFDLYSLFTLRRLLIKENFDILIDAHSSLRSRFLTFLHRAAFRVRYKKSRFKRFMLFFFNINLLSTRKTQEGEFAKLLQPLGITNDFYGSDFYFDRYRDYEALLNSNNLTRDNYVCIVSGAAWRGKQLGISFYQELINFIAAERKDISFVLMGGRKEVKKNKELSHPRCIDLTDRMTLIESIYIASQARITLGSDTGLLHACEAAGGRIAIFLGPTSKETGAYPSKQDSMVFENNIFCRPCSKNGSAPCIWGLGTRRCLNFDVNEISKKIITVL